MLGEQLLGKWGQPGPCAWGPAWEPSPGRGWLPCEQATVPSVPMRGLGSRVLNPDSTSDTFGVCLETPVSGPRLPERGGDREAGSECV